MGTFLLSYDLIKRKDYKTLWDELERLGAHRTLESLWLISLNNTPAEILEHFKKFVDGDDKIWVSELTKKHTFTNAKSGTNKWLENNPPER